MKTVSLIPDPTSVSAYQSPSSSGLTETKDKSAAADDFKKWYMTNTKLSASLCEKMKTSKTTLGRVVAGG